MTLASMFEAITPGGGVIITVPQHQWLWSETDVIAKHARRYERADLIAKMTGVGFECVYATSFVSLLVPLMLASRKRTMNKDKTVGELSLPPLVNAILKKVMAIEFLGIRLGISYPLGGSLLVVGKKGL
jgi:hypothetical protein